MPSKTKNYIGISRIDFEGISIQLADGAGGKIPGIRLVWDLGEKALIFLPEEAQSKIRLSNLPSTLPESDRDLLVRFSRRLLDANHVFEAIRGQPYKNQSVITKQGQYYVRRDDTVRKFRKESEALLSVCKRAGVFLPGRSKEIWTVELQVSNHRLNCYVVDLPRLLNLVGTFAT